MKSILTTFCLFVLCAAFTQNKPDSFDTGEWLRFKMSYSNFLKAGNATLEIKEAKIEDKPVYHVVGKGWTTGMIKWFFKVEDRYESYIRQNRTKTV